MLGTLLFSLVDGALFTEPAPDGQPTRIFAPLWQLAMFLPLLAAGWRRLHDTGRPGWYILIPKLLSLATVLLLLLGVFAAGVMEAAAPDADLPSADPVLGVGVLGLAAMLALQLVASVIMIYWLTRPSQPEANAYGPPVPA